MAQKAILWDLDGTILDSVSVMAEILEEIFPPLGIPLLSREELRSEFHGSLESSLKRMSKNYPNQNVLVETFIAVQPKHYEHPVTHSGMVDIVLALHKRNIKQAVVTSRGSITRGTAGAHAIVDTLGLNSSIEVVISADDCREHKPHPGPLNMALEKLSVSPSNSIMIGDQPADAFAAQAAGTHCIIIDHEETIESKDSLRQANPDELVHSSHELRKALCDYLGILI